MTTTIWHRTRSSSQFELLSINVYCVRISMRVHTIHHFIIYHYYNVIHCYWITHQCRYFDVITLCVCVCMRVYVCVRERENIFIWIHIFSWSMMLIILICVIEIGQNETNSNWIDGNGFNSFIHSFTSIIYSFIHSTCKIISVTSDRNTNHVFS